jgi:four helix bundle protein
MTPEELKNRTKRFALEIIRLVAACQRNAVNDVVFRQLLRSATSVGANYRAACRARSRAEFASKIGIVEEEADECAYWLELLEESGHVSANRTSVLLKEIREITAIAAASQKTARSRAIGNHAKKPVPRGHCGAMQNGQSPMANRHSAIGNRQSP